MFQFQRISNYGTRTPAVARTLPQGADLLAWFVATDEQKEECKRTLMDLCNQLLRCVAIQERIATATSAGLATAPQQQHARPLQNRSILLPSVPDLETDAQSFLQAAKLAIGETARLTESFYKVKRDHKFHAFARWALSQFGPDDDFTRMVSEAEPWVQEIVNLRNAVDHPKDEPRGRLHVYNFRMAVQPSGVLLEPAWALTGEPETPIVADMAAITEGIIQLGEAVLVAMFHKFKPAVPDLVVYEIPEADRDPRFPKRLRVGVVPSSPT